MYSCISLHLIVFCQTVTYCYSNNVSTDNFTEPQRNGTSTSTSGNNLTQGPSIFPFSSTFTKGAEKASTSDREQFAEPVDRTASPTEVVIPAWAISVAVILLLLTMSVLGYVAYITYSHSDSDARAKSQPTKKNPGHVPMKEIRLGKLQKDKYSLVDERMTSTRTADVSVADEGKKAIRTHDSACTANISFNPEYNCQEISAIDENRAMPKGSDITLI